METKPHSDNQQQKKPTILSVDDEPVNQVVIENLLSQHFKVIKAMDGHEALQILQSLPKQEKPDFMLLDVMMPAMSGYEVCARVREEYSHTELPIIMLSANSQPQSIVEGLRKGANDYMSKPVQKDVLLAKIKVQMMICSQCRTIHTDRALGDVYVCARCRDRQAPTATATTTPTSLTPRLDLPDLSAICTELLNHFPARVSITVYNNKRGVVLRNEAAHQREEQALAVSRAKAAGSSTSDFSNSAAAPPDEPFREKDFLPHVPRAIAEEIFDDVAAHGRSISRSVPLLYGLGSVYISAAPFRMPLDPGEQTLIFVHEEQQQREGGGGGLVLGAGAPSAPTTPPSMAASAADTAVEIERMRNEISQLESEIAELKSMHVRKDEALSDIAHDLKTPLNGVIGLAETLEGTDTVGLIVATARRMASMVQDICDCSDLNFDRIALANPTPVNLLQLVDEVIQVAAGDTTVKIRNSIQAQQKLPRVQADERRLHQLLTYIVQNSTKYTSGGVVDISAQVINVSATTTSSSSSAHAKKSKPPAAAAAGEQQQHLGHGQHQQHLGHGQHQQQQQQVVEVSVTCGRGISTDALRMLFDNPYDQPLTSPELKVTSRLRLVTAKKFVELHGGTLSVRAHDRTGSVVVFTLPLPTSSSSSSSGSTAAQTHRITSSPTSDDEDQETSETAAGATAAAATSTTNNGPARRSSWHQLVGADAASSGGAAAAAPPPAPAPLNILSVDDDPINQVVVSNLLTQHGYKVDKAMDGLEALQVLQDPAKPFPHLILLDCMMPKMSGYECCEMIRKLFPQEHIPIIMFSAKNQVDNTVRSLKAGANDVMTKPFSKTELMARIDTQLKVANAWRLMVEKKTSDHLLAQMLPTSIISRLKLQVQSLAADTQLLDSSSSSSSSLYGQHPVIADRFKMVTVLFSDIVDFTPLASRISTEELITILNDMFSRFDQLVDRHGVYKVETIGDAYMVAGGAPEADDVHGQLHNVMALAIDMLKATEDMQTRDGTKIRVRIGVHCGPAYGGVVGLKMPHYCLFGDTVNTASRMESHGLPGRIHVSAPVYEMLKESYHFVERGELEIKGKGKMKTYVYPADLYEDLAAAATYGGVNLHKHSPAAAPTTSSCTVSSSISSSSSNISVSTEDVEAYNTRLALVQAQTEVQRLYEVLATKETTIHDLSQQLDVAVAAAAALRSAAALAQATIDTLNNDLRQSNEGATLLRAAVAQLDAEKAIVQATVSKLESELWSAQESVRALRHQQQQQYQQQQQQQQQQLLASAAAAARPNHHDDDGGSNERYDIVAAAAAASAPPTVAAMAIPTPFQQQFQAQHQQQQQYHQQQLPQIEVHGLGGHTGAGGAGGAGGAVRSFEAYPQQESNTNVTSTATATSSSNYYPYFQHIPYDSNIHPPPQPQLHQHQHQHQQQQQLLQQQQQQQQQMEEGELVLEQDHLEEYTGASAAASSSNSVHHQVHLHQSQSLMMMAPPPAPAAASSSSSSVSQQQQQLNNNLLPWKSIFELLHKLSLEEYMENFLDEDMVELSDVLSATDADLATLGLSIGHRRRLLREVAPFAAVQRSAVLRTEKLVLRNHRKMVNNLNQF